MNADAFFDFLGKTATDFQKVIDEYRMNTGKEPKAIRIVMPELRFNGIEIEFTSKDVTDVSIVVQKS